MQEEYEIEPFTFGQVSPWAATSQLRDGPMNSKPKSARNITVDFNKKGNLTKPMAKAMPHQIPQSLMDELLNDLKTRPPVQPPKSRAAQQMQRLRGKGTLLMEQAKLARERALLAKDKLKARTKTALTKPGMMTGRMPTLRGAGGGLIGMFMEGPEMQKAKTDPYYGLPKKQKQRVENAWIHGT